MMLERIFISIVITSLVGTVLAAVLLLLKPLTRKAFTASWNYYIWVCVLAVMILPLRITLPERMTDEAVHKAIDIEISEAVNTEGIQVPFDEATEAELAESVTPVTQTDSQKTGISDVLKSIIPIASVVWISGAAIVFVWKLIKYSLFLNRTYKKSCCANLTELQSIADKRISVRISENISSPLMTGVIEPMLLLPDIRLTDEQLDNVILHEMTHYKRRDMLVKWFSLIVKSIHFFNPAVYFICNQLDEECEISCDAAVVKDMTREKELMYINTILSLLSESVSKRIPLTTGMTGSKETLKKRFVLIKNKKRTSKIVIFVSVIAAVVLIAISLLSGSIINGSIIKDGDEITPVLKDTSTDAPYAVSYIGYIENAETDYIKLYTEKNGEYVMSIPWAIVEPFPANNRNDENYTFGWMEFMKFYCGEIGNFRWAVVAANGVMNASHTNVCTSTDGGQNWYVDNTNYMRKGIVDNAWFVSETEGYITYSGGGYGKGISKTTDGGRTWDHKMEYDMPLPLSSEDAALLLKYQLITAYEIRYGEYVPRYDDPGSMAGDKERLPYIIETLRITKDDGEYYTVPVIWDFLIEKETGRIYKFYDGLDKMLIPFEPMDENALSFAG